MLATLVVILLDASLFIKFASGNQLLLCIYPAQQVQGITCSKDGSSIISIDSIQATRLGKDTTTCAEERSRNTPVISRCTYALNNSVFYYQYQYPRCNLQRSCLVNGDFPSAITILSSDSCTDDSTGRERNAVIINWSCVAAAGYWSPKNGSDASTTSEISTTTSPAGSNNGGVISLAVFGTIVGSIVFITFVIVTAACLLILARKGKLRSWLELVEKLQKSSSGSDGRAGDIKTERI